MVDMSSDRGLMTLIYTFGDNEPSNLEYLG